ncbi:LytR/AlgR family response regulator transcription factor [Flagellimonas pelagia]|uniref:DNA-binding response regulator n=1 Tax=Flagellimonas pelagia TaxID=2306998 RepID=A0A3A1NL61_9FLAO|nr:LytTR family DNA-binding domain-containing protein [Allomuricauda maritima]RIV46919.1 DNA-binding response regulator [Allomuricauda maritima]TXJ99808.1 response regulator transcription factor [Allomuricauda maritima]
MIRAVALDDEELALDVVQAYCGQIEYVDLVHVFTEQGKAIRYLNKFEVDLLFLDIRMPELNGIDLYKSLKNKTKVIFTTAYDHYAVEGFNVDAIDYLLKPFSFERFKKAVDKAKNLMDLELGNVDEKTHLSVRADFKLHHITLDDILLIEALDDYIQIHLEQGNKIVARNTMKGILEKLPQPQFLRAHRSYIIPLKKVGSIYKDTAKIGNFTVPLGKSYKADILKNL